ncbi:MAG: hypothetical protein WCP39_08275 [Chlamydiota bacterium]
MDKKTILFLILLTLSLLFIQNWFSEKNNPPVPVQQEQKAVQEAIKKEEKICPPLSEKETFYVLENDYLQIVFSNYGGAISEINLPFHSETNPKSIVNSIEFDRWIQKNSPTNGNFPLHPYYSASDKEPLKPKEGGYYPLLRRSQLDASGQYVHKIPHCFYALQLRNKDSEGENWLFQVTRFEKTFIEFTHQDSHRKIVKIFSLPESDIPYCFEMSIQLEGDSKNFWITSKNTPSSCNRK